MRRATRAGAGVSILRAIWLSLRFQRTLTDPCGVGTSPAAHERSHGSGSIRTFAKPGARGRTPSTCAGSEYVGPADQPLAAVAMLTRRLSRLPFAVAYVPKGPTLDWSDAAAVAGALASIERAARRQGALFVKIDPDVSADVAYASAVQRTLRARGWRPSSEQVQFRNTMLIDLIDEEEALLGRKDRKSVV